MSRLRYNNAGGTLGAPGLSSGATAIAFTTAPPFATLAAGDYIPLVIEPPQGSTPSANFEIVYLTAYTAGQTTGTVTRAQEGTSAVAHANGATWACSPVAADFGPANPILSQQYGPMPVSLGASGMYRMPFIGGASVTYTLDRASLHLETAGSSPTTLILEKSHGTSTFIASTVATLTLAAAATQADITAGLGTLVSGDLIRWRWAALGAGAQSFAAQLEGHS